MGRHASVLALTLLLAVAGHAWAGQVFFQPRQIIAIPVTSSGTYNPVDSATDYIGIRHASSPGAAGFRRVYTPPGVWFVVGFKGSAAKTGGETSTTELSTWSVLLNGVTSLGNIGTFAHPTVSANLEHWQFDDLNLGPMRGGDFFEMGMTHPAWVTNPTGTIYWGIVYMERRGR